MKLLVLIAAISAIVACNAQSNHVFWGQAGANHTRILTQAVIKDSSILQITETDVRFPLPGYTNTRLISAIYAYDQKTNGNGATATLTSGGINATSVNVHFKSIRGHGINFILEIYVR